MKTISFTGIFSEFGIPKKAVRCFLQDDLGVVVIEVRRPNGDRKQTQIDRKEILDGVESNAVFEAVKDQVAWYYGSLEKAMAIIKAKAAYERQKRETLKLQIWTAFTAAIWIAVIMLGVKLYL